MAATALNHSGGGGLREGDLSAKVHFEQPVDLWPGQIGQRPDGRDAGIGSQHVDLPHLADQPLHLVAVPQVARDRAGPELLGERLEHIGPAAGEEQRRAARSERPCDRLPEPAGGPGDEHSARDQVAGRHATERPLLHRVAAVDG